MRMLLDQKALKLKLQKGYQKPYHKAHERRELFFKNLPWHCFQIKQYLKGLTQRNPQFYQRMLKKMFKNSTVVI